MNSILRLAIRDPKQALQLAINFHGPPEIRAQTLVLLAGNLVDHHPAVARAALAEAAKLFSAGLKPEFFASDLKDAAEVFLGLKDEDSALKMIAAGMKLAEEQYAKDTIASDPNIAPKSKWPSTRLFQQFVVLSMRMSSELALKLIGEISDPELRPFLRVAVASSLLGGPEPELYHALRQSKTNGVTEIW